MIIHYSQLQTYLICPRKWMYAYWQRIAPDVQRDYFVFGTVFHEVIQYVLVNGLESEEPWPVSNSITYIDRSGEVQIVENPEAVTREWAQQWLLSWNMAVGFTLDNKSVVGTEIEVHVPADNWMLVGKIDAILEYPGGQRMIVDHKGCNSLPSPGYHMHADLQGSLYCLLAMKNELIETPWFVYHYYKRKVPPKPKLLKDGKLSTSRNQGTDKIRFFQAVEEYGLDIQDYADFYASLPDQNMVATFQSQRTQEQLNEATWTLFKTMDEIIETTKQLEAIGVEPGVNAPVPNMAGVIRIVRRDCSTSCIYKSICEAELMGWDSRPCRERFTVVPERYRLEESEGD